MDGSGVGIVRASTTRIFGASHRKIRSPFFFAIDLPSMRPVSLTPSIL
jgi:hypothetical protein